MAKQPLSHSQGLSGFSSFLCKWPPCGEDLIFWKFGVWTISVQTEPKSTLKISQGPVSRSAGQRGQSLQNSVRENRAPYRPSTAAPPLLLPCSLPSLSLSFRSPPHLSFLDCLHLTHHQILPRVIHTSPLCTVLLSAWPFPSSDCHCCSALLGDPWTIVSSPSFPTRPSSRLLLGYTS